MKELNQKIDNIIKQLEGLKTEKASKDEMLKFCKDFEKALIERLEASGGRYDPDLNQINKNNLAPNKKFFAFKKHDYDEDFTGDLNRMLAVIIQEVNCDNFVFNFATVEGIRDDHGFADLIRGLVYFKRLPKVSLYEKVKRMSLDEMAEWLFDFIYDPKKCCRHEHIRNLKELLSIESEQA